MKLALRDLKQEKWELEVNETDTVSRVKEQNARLRGLGDDMQQKLIYSGKILRDTDPISVYKINPEKDFVVCMVSKKKASPKPTTPAVAIPAKASPAGTPTPEAAAAPIPPSAGVPAAASEPAQLEGPSEFATGSRLTTAIDNMVEMGYERPLVVAAMRMAYNNPDRAAEYLVTGEAETALEQQQQQQQQQQQRRQQRQQEQQQSAAEPGPDRPATSPQATEVPTHPRTAHTDTTDINLFEAGSTHEPEGPHDVEGPDNTELLQLREAIRQNPSLIGPLIQQLVSQNPGNADAIARNLSELMREDEDGEGLPGLGDEGSDSEAAMQVEVTPEDNEAISRLMELGFDQALVLQIYFACGKNEELTANYLLEHGDEE